MRREIITRIVTVVGMIGIVLFPVILSAQERHFTDFRGQDYTAEDLGAALFPTGPEVGTRGIAPQQAPQASVPKASVALNVFFEFNSDKVLPQYYPDLDKLGQVLTNPRYADYRVQIEGHTDSIGSDRYNQALSERRAMSVKRYLIQNFPIDPSRLVVKGYGERRPIASNDTPEGRSRNRRVEVVNLGRE
ncbi:MAG: OmpA family protein [Nitrospinota bacterium]|nr:MAG: OmpA family protein [Nitrospinota bacterium]